MLVCSVCGEKMIMLSEYTFVCKEYCLSPEAKKAMEKMDKKLKQAILDYLTVPQNCDIEFVGLEKIIKG